MIMSSSSLLDARPIAVGVLAPKPYAFTVLDTQTIPARAVAAFAAGLISSQIRAKVVDLTHVPYRPLEEEQRRRSQGVLLMMLIQSNLPVIAQKELVQFFATRWLTTKPQKPRALSTMKSLSWISHQFKMQFQASYDETVIEAIAIPHVRFFIDLALNGKKLTRFILWDDIFHTFPLIAPTYKSKSSKGRMSWVRAGDWYETGMGPGFESAVLTLIGTGGLAWQMLEKYQSYNVTDFLSLFGIFLGVVAIAATSGTFVSLYVNDALHRGTRNYGEKTLKVAHWRGIYALVAAGLSMLGLHGHGDILLTGKQFVIGLVTSYWLGHAAHHYRWNWTHDWKDRMSWFYHSRITSAA